MSHIEEYYIKQAQTGSGMNYFAGTSTQKGAGIGSFLGGLFRNIFPFLKEGASAVGREALRAGSHILADAATGGLPLKNSVRQHFSEAGKNLVNKMRGKGIKRARVKARAQSVRGTRTGRTRKRAKVNTKTTQHIF